MTRPIVLGNQQLLANIDEWLQLRDLTYPHVGQYNHLVGHANRFAIIEAGTVSWINDPEWERRLGYEDGALIGDSTAHSEEKELSVRFKDAVADDHNVLFRLLTVTNHSDHERTVRVASHHDFHLYQDGIGDTAIFSPEADSIIHYKRATYILCGFIRSDGTSAMSDYDIGETVDVANPTRNTIAQGSVDSMIAADLHLPAGASAQVCYCVCVSDTLDNVQRLHSRIIRDGYQAHLERTREHHRGLVAKARSPDLPPRLKTLYERSLLIIRTQMDHDGAITAANDSDNMQYNRDTYSYLWPRDGALVAIALVKAGLAHMTRPFFRFCRDVLTEEGCLLHKYHPDRTLGSSWHPWIYDGKHSIPIQEDETALVLHALWVYYESTGDEDFIRELSNPLIRPALGFLRQYRYGNGLPQESYDLWEERRGIFTWTTAAVLAGLRGGERLLHVCDGEDLCGSCEAHNPRTLSALDEYLWDVDKGRFRRSVHLEHGRLHYDDMLDASWMGVFLFGVLPADDERVESSMRATQELLGVAGGIARSEEDYYHRVVDDAPGNPWFITTLWRAQWLIARASDEAQLQEALGILEWCADRALSTGAFPEQLHPVSLEPLSVCPLTWSHSTFVEACIEYSDKASSLQQGDPDQGP